VVWKQSVIWFKENGRQRRMLCRLHSEVSVGSACVLNVLCLYVFIILFVSAYCH
jgi:hypothetical protein